MKTKLISVRIIYTQPMKFIKDHIPGLLGILLLLFDFMYNLSRGVFNLSFINIFFLPVGLSLLFTEILPERTKILLINFPWINAIDKMIFKYSIGFLCLLIGTGFYLRFNDLGNLSFTTDELITSYAAIGIFQHGIPALPLGNLYTLSIFNTSLIALSFKIFGISEFSARIVSVIFGTLTILLVYLIGVKAANKRVGLLAAVLITFSSMEILWSRQARIYAEFQFFYLLTVYLFYLGLNKKDIRILSLSAIAFIGAYFDHILAVTFLPVVLVYLIYFKKYIFKNRYYIYKSIGIIFGLFFVFMIFAGKTIKNYIFMNVQPEVQEQYYYYVFSSYINILLILSLISIIISIILWKYRLLKNNIDNTYILLNFFIPFLILNLYIWKDSRYALFIFPFLVLFASNAIDLYVIQNIINEDVLLRISSALKMKMRSIRNIKFSILLILVFLLFVQMISSINSFYLSQNNVVTGIFDADKEIDYDLVFGWTSDVQYSLNPNEGTKAYSSSITRFNSFINYMNTQKVSFIIEEGDLIDGSLDGKAQTLIELDEIENIYNNFVGPRYYVLGNHDVRKITVEDFKNHTGMNTTGAYGNTSFDAGNYHFVILDEQYDWMFGWHRDPLLFASEGYIPQSEIDWLISDLNATTKKTIIFSHQLLENDSSKRANLTVHNAAQVRSVLENSGKVIGIFEGHEHVNQHYIINGIHYFQIQAMLQSEGRNSYAKVYLKGDNIYVDGFEYGFSCIKEDAWKEYNYNVRLNKLGLYHHINFCQ